VGGHKLSTVKMSSATSNQNPGVFPGWALLSNTEKVWTDEVVSCLFAVRLRLPEVCLSGLPLGRSGRSLPLGGLPKLKPS